MTALDAFLAQLAVDPKEWPKEYRRPDDLRHWPDILRLAENWSIPVIKVESDSFVGDYQWDGDTIIASRGDNLIHDIAHYQCAHPDRRFLKDFGLGAGPDSFENPPCLVSCEEAEFEEGCASLLGILWEIKFQMPFGCTMSYHRWYIEPRTADPQIQFLEKHGLLRNGNPIAALRQG